MSLDLKDLKRLKITGATRAWLTAKAHVTGRKPQDIARDALDEIARREIHAAKVITSLADSEAQLGADRGHTGASRGRGR